MFELFKFIGYCVSNLYNTLNFKILDMRGSPPTSKIKKWPFLLCHMYQEVSNKRKIKMIITIFITIKNISNYRKRRSLKTVSFNILKKSELTKHSIMTLVEPAVFKIWVDVAANMDPVQRQYSDSVVIRQLPRLIVWSVNFIHLSLSINSDHLLW